MNDGFRKYMQLSALAEKYYECEYGNLLEEQQEEIVKLWEKGERA